MNNETKDDKHTLALRYITGLDRMEDIKQLFLEYAESLPIDLGFQNFEAELKSLPGKYGPPDGVLIMALLDDYPAGCIALRKISENVCEMKRLYVREKYQGFGIGKKLITMAIEDATKLGYGSMRLDTLPSMKKAQDLYTSFGFYDIDPYVYNPIQGTRFMELKL
jgi:GNAT superfamily N-acetyltransferase